MRHLCIQINIYAPRPRWVSISASALLCIRPLVQASILSSSSTLHSQPESSSSETSCWSSSTPRECRHLSCAPSCPPSWPPSCPSCPPWPPSWCPEGPWLWPSSVWLVFWLVVLVLGWDMQVIKAIHWSYGNQQLFSSWIWNFYHFLSQV